VWLRLRMFQSALRTKLASRDQAALNLATYAGAPFVATISMRMTPHRVYIWPSSMQLCMCQNSMSLQSNAGDVLRALDGFKDAAFVQGWSWAPGSGRRRGRCWS